jgi:hypothetical protein
MSQPKNVKPADLVEGFGAAAYGGHIFRVEIPVAANGDITIVEDYGLKGGENGVPPREARVVLPRRFWSAIAETARKDFVARLKAKKLTSTRWTTGGNKVDRMLGKELCVLAWASEHANSVDECKAIAAKWAALKPEERWWLFSQTAAEAGLPDDKEAGWRKALYYALSSGKAENKKLRSARPAEDGPTTPQLF